MVKLATARERRVYGSGRRSSSRERWEYTNAGVYLFSTIVFLCGFVAQLSREPKSGVVLLLIALGFIILVNLHDLLAHLPPIDIAIMLLHLDPQLLLVEVAVPALYAFGALLFFIALLLLLLQVDRGFGYDKIEAHVLHLLIAASSFWVLGSIHNSCQIYHQSPPMFQLLQRTVQLPFFIASFLFFLGALFNFLGPPPHHHHGLYLLTDTWVWISIIATSFLLFGGLANVFKVVKMLQMEPGFNLEKLRGGAQHLLLLQQQHQQEDDGFLLQQGQSTRPRHHL